ncbi:MAG: hypothetical protein L0387_44630, partial [Acidobacteria bacterium]|nr:hypothetical protein [Acidobacteriota bacterium]
MNSEFTWRLFELHRANLQSVSRAQKIYLTTLLTYLALIWGWYLFGGRNDITIQMLGITVKSNAFWAVTPAVVTLFALALIGSINAAEPIWRKLRDT